MTRASDLPPGANDRFWGTRTHPITGETMWAPTATGMCPTCGEMFTSDTGFDMHRRFRRGQCTDPEKVGLVAHDNPAGYRVWSQPGPANSTAWGRK